jgi:ABC-type nitrate/sulfonate/bicarbonate transport system substrate-binding protein
MAEQTPAAPEDDLPPSLPRRGDGGRPVPRERALQIVPPVKQDRPDDVMDAFSETVPVRKSSTAAAAFMRTLVGAGLLGFIALLAYLIFPRGGGAAQYEERAPTAAVVQNPTQAPVLAVATPTARAVAEVQPVVEIKPAETAAQPTPAPAPTNTRVPVPAPTVDRTPFVAKPLADAPAGAPNPYFGPNYDPNDGKPVVLCVSDPTVTHLTLQQIQVRGLDIANGFHLGIIPLGIADGYRLSEEEYSGRVKRGEWDCVPDRTDENAELNIGVVTAVMSESAGDDGIWARDIPSIYALPGKRLGFVDDTSAKYFAKVALSLLSAETRTTVQLSGYATPADAVAAFNRGEIDAVAAWQPFLGDAASSGGKPLLMTDQLRVITSALIFSRKSVGERPEVVQAFHRAWFTAVRDQIDNPAAAAADIARWGANDWTRIRPETAEADLTARLKSVAVAHIEHNIALFEDREPLLKQLDTARTVRTLAGDEIDPVPLGDLIDGRFVAALADDSTLKPNRSPVNGSFSLAAPTILGDSAEASVALPCTDFAFLPDSTDLTPDALRVLDICVIPALTQRPGTRLKIVGTSAWPRGRGFDEDSVRQYGALRAQSIANYLITRGVEAIRLDVEGTLPPVERREIDDQALLKQDRSVQMTIVLGGW